MCAWTTVFHRNMLLIPHVISLNSAAHCGKALRINSAVDSGLKK